MSYSRDFDYSRQMYYINRSEGHNRHSDDILIVDKFRFFEVERDRLD